MNDNKKAANLPADEAEKAENMQKELPDEQLDDVSGGSRPPAVAPSIKSPTRL